VALFDAGRRLTSANACARSTSASACFAAASARFGDAAGIPPATARAATGFARHGDRLRARHCARRSFREQVLQVAELGHPSGLRFEVASASSAAMQPVPADVTAWR
jgi:hypothetical protein